MSFEEAPGIEDIKGRYKRPERPKTRRKRVRLIIAINILLLAGLGILSFFRSDIYEEIVGYGAVSGYAVDESGNPIAVEVFFFGASTIETSDSSGHFRLDRVPYGEQSLIVAYDVVAVEIKINVETGQEIFTGTVTIPIDDLKYFTE